MSILRAPHVAGSSTWRWLRCSVLAAALCARSAAADCTYPGSVAIASEAYTFDPAVCGIDYRKYVETPVSEEDLVAAYSSRCPGSIAAGAKVYKIGGLAIRGAQVFYTSYRDTFETYASLSQVLLPRTALPGSARKLQVVRSSPAWFQCGHAVLQDRLPCTMPVPVYLKRWLQQITITVRVRLKRLLHSVAHCAEGSVTVIGTCGQPVCSLTMRTQQRV